MFISFTVSCLLYGSLTKITGKVFLGPIFPFWGYPVSSWLWMNVVFSLENIKSLDGLNNNPLMLYGLPYSDMADFNLCIVYKFY